jgi:hypothetical protein
MLAKASIHASFKSLILSILVATRMLAWMAACAAMTVRVPGCG